MWDFLFYSCMSSHPGMWGELFFFFFFFENRNFFRVVFLFFELERFPSETQEKYEKFFNLRTRKFDF